MTATVQPSLSLPLAPEPAAAPGRGCGRCEVLPDLLAGEGTLHLWFPMGHTRARAVSRLRELGWAVAVPGDEYVQVPVAGERLHEVTGPLAERLSQLECEDTRALFREGPGLPGAEDVPRVQSLHQLSARAGSAWLVDVLAGERLESAYQPIVHAADPSRIFAQEALLRGRAPDGAIIGPGAMFDAARAGGLLFQLDLAARRAAIRGAIRHGIPHSVFINFTPTAIYDPSTCLRTTVRAIDEGGIEHDRIVFEVIESERAADVGHLQRILAFYREAGFRVALDDIGSGYSSLNLLHQLRPDFVKLDMNLVRGVHADPYKALVAAKLLELAAALGIETVAEGVETEEELAWVREHGATYVQGYLVARPSFTPVTRLA